MTIFAVLNLFGCSEKEITLPKYMNNECYYGEGFQDYTDYCKYYYNEETITQFETHTQFEKVSNSDVENIKSYFEDFGEWVKNESYCDKYDFDIQSQIKKDDYFCIIIKEGDKIGDSVYGKFECYDVYYADMSKCVLYFVHSNK